jgi:hypothetical protein
VSSTRDRALLPNTTASPDSRRNARRATVLLLFVIVLFTVLFLRIRLMESSGHRPLEAVQSVLPTWKVSACSVVPDNRIAEGQSVQLTLLGSSTIRATVWDSKCRIPLGTEFRRDGDFICNPSVAGPYDSGCFGVESETGR